MHRVLLIEDDESLRTVCGERLRMEGYEVAVATNGKDGLALAHQLHPDIIVCDILMPGLNGYQVIAQLRQDADVADIPVIFLTALSEHSDLRRGMLAGADDYLTKPFASEDLLAAISSRLARSDVQRLIQRRALDTISETLGSLIHEIRSPLSAALLYAEALCQPHEMESPRKGGGGIEAILPTLRRLGTLTDEILNFTRCRLEGPAYTPTSFDFAALCLQTAGDFQEPSRIRLMLPAHGLPVVADQRLCRYLVRNLIDNALKYSPTTEMVDIHLRMISDNALELRVRDRGIGLPEHERSRIFMPFFRGSNAYGRPGTGLGLPLVLQCVERHGGRIEVCTPDGPGTQFVVMLPIAERAKLHDGTRA